MPAPRKRPENLRRRMVIPPPVWKTSSGIEGLEILEEVGGDEGGVLWRTHRAALMWARSTAEKEGAALTTGAGIERIDAELGAVARQGIPIHAVRSIFVRSLDARSRDAEAMALACGEIRDWAATQKYRSTTDAFKRAAALCWPASPLLAFEAGVSALSLGDRSAGAGWLQRAIGLARRGKEWQTYARSYVALAEDAEKNGALEAAAAKLWIRAMRTIDRRIPGGPLRDEMRRLIPQKYRSALLEDRQTQQVRFAETQPSKPL